MYMKHGKSVSSSLVRYMFALIMTYFCCAATSMVTSAGTRAISSTNLRSMFLHLQSCIRLPFVWCCYSICIAIKRVGQMYRSGTMLICYRMMTIPTLRSSLQGREKASQSSTPSCGKSPTWLSPAGSSHSPCCRTGQPGCSHTP